MTRGDEVLLAFGAFSLVLMLWILAPAGLPRRLRLTPDPVDGVPTITADEFREAAREFRQWAWKRWPVLALPIVAGIGGWKFATPAIGAALSGLGFDILGAFVLAEGLLDLSIIRWIGTWDWAGARSRQTALSGREKAVRGFILIGLGFLLQAIGAVLSGAALTQSRAP